MATINCTNTIAHQAYRGQSVYVSLSGAESLSVLPVLAVGQSAVVSSSGATGVIDFVDTKGHTFRVKPKRPETSFCSNKTNTLSIDELITITY